MRQRVAIAMALLARPDLLIADEPTTALDATCRLADPDQLEAHRNWPLNYPHLFRLRRLAQRTKPAQRVSI